MSLVHVVFKMNYNSIFLLFPIKSFTFLLEVVLEETSIYVRKCIHINHSLHVLSVSNLHQVFKYKINHHLINPSLQSLPYISLLGCRDYALQISIHLVGLVCPLYEEIIESMECFWLDKCM